MAKVESERRINIEIVYATAQHSIVKNLKLKPGALLTEALRAAAAEPDFAGMDLANAPVGIFGVLARDDQQLKEGDRIEVYRPLSAEPKQARRARARAARQ